MEKDFQVYKKNKKSLKRFIKSFGYAGQGIKYCFYHEQNIIVMFIMAIIALVLGMIFNITYMERLIILVLIGMILALELLNTSIEAVVNLHEGNKKSHYGKVAKDCASGAVAVACILALIIGILIFMPYILNLF